LEVLHPRQQGENWHFLGAMRVPSQMPGDIRKKMNLQENVYWLMHYTIESQMVDILTTPKHA
jgi:hypothetical protein